MKNIDFKTVESFGDEWTKFDQTKLSEIEAQNIFNKYFNIFPWKIISKTSEGFDMGCGTGRWASFVAPKVGKLNCVDPSHAINIARLRLKKFSNIRIHDCSLDEVKLEKNSQDFGYSLGVLHHVPDTQLAIKSCVDLLKPGSPFLIYLYYSFDNRPFWFFYLWKITNYLRLIISRLPSKLKIIVTDLLAICIYYPIAKICLFLKKININVKNFPLSFYADKTFYTMRTDSRDRFGTRLEKRFSKKEIKKMMENAGLDNIDFSKNEPYWCAIGYKKK